MSIYSADLLFNGETFLPHHALITSNNKIESVLPIVSLPENAEISSHVYMIAPAFIDLQIYGASGKLFSAYPTIETLQAINDHCTKSGCFLFQPTIATNTKEVIFKCIDAIKQYKHAFGKGVHGMHLEGPWINKAKRGAHIESMVRSPTPAEVKELLDYADGAITMITLAPEVCDAEIINLIRSRDIIISAGHSNADFDEAFAAFENGIQTVTHLFNAMTPINHREPGLAVAAMLDDSVVASIIADGYHVDFEMIKLAKKMMGHRLLLITDAVTDTNEGPYQHYKEGDKYMANGILSGSALTMLQAIKNCVSHAGIHVEEAMRMASFYPAKVLGLENKLGRIATGYEASFVLLNEDMQVMPRD